MRGRDVELELLHQPRETRCLSLRQLEDQPGQSRRVDDRVLERALEPAADEPGVERVVAVLDEDGAAGESQEPAPRILELRGADEHGAVDQVTLAGVRVDRCAAVDQGVEEGQRALEGEAFRPHLEHQERGVAGGLDVERDKLSVLQRSGEADLGRVDRDLLPRHKLPSAARLEIKPFLAHQRAIARARRAHRISSRSRARSSSTAAA